MNEGGLRRSLSLPLLTFYGLGTILGAGIYVLIAAVTAEAGAAMPLSFLLAGIIASFTAFSYAELASRYPRAAAEAVYVERAFGRPVLSAVVGYALVGVGIVSAATLTRGFVGYVAVFVDVPAPLAMTLLVLGLGTLAAVGMLASARIISAVTLIEIAGLVFIIGGAFEATADVGSELARLAADIEPGAATGVLSGAFLAFYAFLGFEDMVNVAEEVHAPARTLPRAIVLALVLSTGLYLLVACAVLLALPPAALAASTAPLADVTAALGYDPRLLGAISLVAVINGALVQIIKASRVLYGLACQGSAPRACARVSARTGTPLVATGAATAAVLAFALAMPLVSLAALTSAVTLGLFVLVNAALWWLKRRGETVAGAVSYPVWVPAIGAVLSLALCVAAVLVG